ncbi:MAG: DUF2142 domain-containing protein [Pseudomonadota bacterium]
MALSLCAALISAWVPPFQSPDEFHHVVRAAALSNGTIGIETPSGQRSGARVDSGVAEYIALYVSSDGSPRNNVTPEETAAASAITWNGTTVFEEAPGTGYYFPLIYAPQAAALFIGRNTGLSVDMSYRLARGSVLISATLLMLLAVHLSRPPVLVLTLLVMPMMLFQFGSATIDAVSTALAMALLAGFVRLMREADAARGGEVLAMTLGVFVLASCRLHCAAFVLLLFALSLNTRSRIWLICGMATTAALLSWYALAATDVSDLRGTADPSSLEIVAYYAQRPISLVQVILETVSNIDTVKFYTAQFVGLLGWRNPWFVSLVYNGFVIVLGLALILSIAETDAAKRPLASAALLATSICAGILVFFALLIAWTPHPATTVTGIQGRYFMIPALALGYALSASEQRQRLARWSPWMNGFLWSILLVSTILSVDILAARHHGGGVIGVMATSGAT